MAIATVKRRRRNTLVVSPGIERQLRNFFAAFGTNPHDAVFRTEHGTLRTAETALRIVSLKHYAKLANPYYFYEIRSEILYTRKLFVKK